MKLTPHTNTPNLEILVGTGHLQTLVCQSRRHFRSIFTCTNGQPQSLHLATSAYGKEQQTVFVMVCVDDLVFLGEQLEVNRIFEAIHQKVLLRPTGELIHGKAISFLSRTLTNKGDDIDITLLL